jgi:arsenical pump membrane protein
MWVVAALAGIAAVASTALPWHDAVDVTTRIGPILTFLAAITVLAHVADGAGVFDVIGIRAARTAGGSTRRLFLLVTAVATLLTITLSLDTTAVLFTPVVLALCGAITVDARPFAYVTVWIANGASLLLPISNLTNLLAVDRLSGISTAEYVRRMALPECAAVAVVLGFSLLVFRRRLQGRYLPPTPYVVADRVTFWVAAIGCAVVAPVSLVGVTPWKVALPTAVLVAVVAAYRHGAVALARSLPWRIVLAIEGIFLAIAALGRHGLDDALRHVTGHHAFLTEIAGAAGGNIVNNLPAYVTLERAVPAHHTDELLALLLGTNVGTMILVTGSLATVLWRERCKARGLQVGAWEFARYGCVLVPALLAATYGALLVTS